MKCGLLGRRLSHSYSPQIHSLLGTYSYTLYEKEPQELEEFLKHGDFTGLNITIPYKKDVIAYCAELTPTAQKLGAVNTLVRSADGSLMGHNTDYFGFSAMVERSGLSVAGKKVLVLGSGGASMTAVAVLQELGAECVVISRTGPNNYGNLSRHDDAAILVNTTPVGMFPNGGTSPVALSQFPKLEGVLDLIYNPARTQLLQEAEQRGLVAENGLWMLVAQAWESAQWFTGHSLDAKKIAQIHRFLRNKTENTILIGMPGCGKSTIGKLLSEKTGKPNIDADDVIVQRAGMSIPEIFDRIGEAGFRALETQVLRELGALSGSIIATGGGCVTRMENYPLLHQNGHIVWLQRNLQDLPTDGRPLSQAKSLSAMYDARKPLYEQFADCIVDNQSSPESTVCAILSMEEQL